VARQYIDGHKLTEGLLNHISRPRLRPTCPAAHVRKMPLEVELLDAEGSESIC
jgi:NAD-reducing hydrogenase large subunit